METNQDIREPIYIKTGENYQEKFSYEDKEIVYNMNAECSTPMGIEMQSKLRLFDDKAWSSQNSGVKSGFPMLDKAFQDGFVPGFYIIAGDSNLGKSTILTQLTWQFLKLNDDIFILDFSLDDPIIDRLSRLMASYTMIPSSCIKFPFKQDEKVLLRRRKGLEFLTNNSDKYLCHDTSTINSIEKIEAEIERVRIELEKAKPNTKLIVLIDSFHDLNYDNKSFSGETAKYNEIAQWCADTSIRQDLILIATGELKKLEKDGTRPTMGSLRESIKIRYEAKAIMFVYNDVHYNNESAEIYFMEENSQDKKPIFEVHVAKNKVSSWKGRLFYYMWPDIGHLRECDEETTRNYRSTIYGK